MIDFILFFFLGTGVGWAVTYETLARQYHNKTVALYKRLTIAEYQDRHRPVQSNKTP